MGTLFYDFLLRYPLIWSSFFQTCLYAYTHKRCLSQIHRTILFDFTFGRRTKIDFREKMYIIDFDMFDYSLIIIDFTYKIDSNMF